MHDALNGGLSGPDFLDQVADAELSNGNEINAAEFRTRARQWREDRQALDDANVALSDVRRRRDETPTPAGWSHAVTPTDRR